MKTQPIARKSLFFGLLLLLVACGGSKEDVKLVETSFGEEVPVQGNLTFVFDHEMIADSLLSIWDSTAYLTFEPPIPGHFSWRSPEELVFAPYQTLSPATTYTARVTKAVLKHKEDLKLAEGQQVTFSTPALQVTQQNTYWAERDQGKNRYFLHLDLSFNYPVEPATLQNSLQIKVGDKIQTLKVVSETVSNTLSAYLPDLPMSDENLSLELQLAAAAVPLGGQNPMAETYTTEIAVASPFLLTINEVMAQHDGAEGELVVSTSQEVKAQDIKRFITITPSVSYQVKVEPQQFRIVSSEFDANSQYELRIKENLIGVLGGKLKSSYAEQLSFGQLRPSVRFRDQQSIYLTSAGSQQIEAEIINVPKVTVSITKVYANNIQSFLGSGYYYYDYDDSYEYYGGSYYYSPDYDYYRSRQLGDLIEKKELQTNTLPLNGSQRLLKLDFEDNIPQYPGVYVVEVRADDPYYMSTQTVVCRSDIGLIAKSSSRGVRIFANSIRTAKALPGVSLTLVGENNQELTQLTTNAEGVASYDFPPDRPAGFALNLVLAAHNGEFSYLPFTRTRVATSRFEVEGKYENSAGLDAYLYGERDIYRPGETLHLAGIVRENDGNTPKDLPVKLRLLSPDGKVFTTLRKTLNKQGAFTADISVPVEARTGSYQAELFASNDVLLNSMRIMVEEFIPDRIKVDLSLDKDEYALETPMELTAKATNFFGPPAAERDYQVEMTVRREGFSAPDYSEYSFYIPNINQNFDRIDRSGKTSSAGEVKESFSLPAAYANTGILKADFFLTVFDETGRPVNRRQQAKVYTQKVFYGAKSSSYYNRTGQVVKIPLIAVDWKGKILNGAKARVRLIKHEYKTVLSRSGSYFRYQSEPNPITLTEEDVTLNGTDYVFQYKPELTGRYELRVSIPGANNYFSTRFYAYGYGGGRNQNSDFQVNREGRVEIELDKAQYKTGEKAQVLITTPFEGRLLVTVETDRVHEHFYMDLDKRSASFALDLKEEYVPNAYITATLIRPHGTSDLPVTVAHGFAPVMVEKEEFKLKLDLAAAATTRSNTKQVIRLKSFPNTPVTVAVVDEGILQLTQFQTPDPYDFFYAKQALEVQSYDIYPFLYPEYNLGNSRPGGDGMDMAKRINPLVNNRVKLASFWSGLLTTDSRGEASFEIDVPQFSGSLRIMASAFNNRAYAAASQNMVVADPVVISMGVPRFFSPGDTVNIPVTFTNTTDQTASLATLFSAEGPLKVLGSTNQKTSLTAKRESRIVYQVVAKPEIGQGKLIMAAEGMGETFQHEVEVTVRPPSTLQKRSGSGQIAVGQTIQVTPDLEAFMPSSVEMNLIVSKSPLVEFSGQLEKLLVPTYAGLTYTISSAFPQLYFNDMAKVILQQKKENPNPAYHIQEAIKRLQLMQLYTGGMTYWPQNGREHWWGSIYAAHFLHEARRAGYAVPEDVERELRKYLVNKLKDVKLETYYYNSREKREIYPQEVAYSLFVLSLTGHPERATMNYYKARLNQLSLCSKYLLGAAYALIGDKTRYREIIPADKVFQGEQADRTFGGSFASYVRDEALALYVLMEVEPEHPQIGNMAKHVSENLKNTRWLNEQERAFSFLALGKIAKQAANTQATATVLFGGREVGNFNGKEALSLHTDQPAQGTYSIKTTGTGKLYYWWETEGISVDGSYVEEDSYLKIRRTFLHRNKGVVVNNTVSQNDLVIVRIEVEGQTNAQVQNLVLTDLLPAGLEIENPRISEMPDLGYSNTYGYDYQDIRDDRIMYMTNLYGTRKATYYYLARAVTPGTFVLGPVSADALYNGEYHSYSGGGTFKILMK